MKLKEKMKSSWKPGRRLVFSLACLVLSVFLLTGNTLAWFTAVDSIVNRLRVADLGLGVDIVDEFVPPGKPGPGDNVYKRVAAVNTGDFPGVVRVLVFPEIVASDGLTALPVSIGDELIISVDTAHWKDGTDGYYYYLDLLQPGGTTPDLFTGVTLSPYLGDEYKRSNLTISVVAELSDPSSFRQTWWNTSSRPSVQTLAEIDDRLSSLI